MSDEIKKKVDDSWKEQIAKETESKTVKEEKPQSIPEINFLGFVSGLAMQAHIFLGEIPNPLTNKQEQDLDQAKYIIDTINMLKDKSKGNLSSEEESLIDALLYELRVKYVEKSKKAE